MNCTSTTRLVQLPGARELSAPCTVGILEMCALRAQKEVPYFHAMLQGKDSLAPSMDIFENKLYGGIHKAATNEPMARQVCHYKGEDAQLFEGFCRICTVVVFRPARSLPYGYGFNPPFEISRHSAGARSLGGAAIS